MYADKDKQREAVREATRRYRLSKGITRVSQDRVSQAKVSPNPVIPEMPSVWGGPECYDSPDKVRPAVKAVIEKRGPVPAWRAEKDAQMARFLSGKR